MRNVIYPIINVLCFFISFYALEGLDFQNILRKSKVVQGRLLHLLLSMALGYLVSQFIFALKI